jgi:MFS family permease
VAESTAAFLKLGSGWLSDRVRRRKPLVFWGYAIASVARPLVGLVSASWQLLAVRFADRVGKGIRSAPRDALLAESVPADRRGLAFGVHRAADHAGAVLGPLLASGLLLLLPGKLRWVFLLALIPGLLSLLVILLKVREQRAAASGQVVAAAAAGAAATGALRERRPERVARGQQPADAPGGLVRRMRSAARGPLGPFLLVLVLFTLGNATDAFLLLRAQDLGVPLALIPLLWGAHHVSKMGWNVAGGLIADRLGPQRAIVAGWLVYALTYAAFAFAGSAWHAWALFLLYGLFYGLTEAPEKALVARLAHAGRRGSAFGAYHFAIGIAALPASFIFGLIWSAQGARTALLFGASLALLAAVALPLLVRVPAEPPGGNGILARDA